MDGFHEILVVQEGLAHPHKDQVDAFKGWRNVLIVKNRTHLSHNLPRAKVPFYSQERGQTEFTVHRATHLAGDTYGCAFPGATCRFGLVAGLAAVACLSPISFRHPD